MKGFLGGLLLATVLGGVWAVVPTTAWAAPRVELELITEPGFPPTGTHQWLALLKDLNLGSLRIRAARPGDRVEIRQRGSGDSIIYHVTGLLTRRNALRLPGAEFRYGDRAGIARWVARLKEGGQAGLSEGPAAFGLTPSELVAVHEALSAPVAFSTKGQRSFDAIKRIADGLALSFAADAAAIAKMAVDEPVRDELQGLSAGTAVAAILRPLGLAMVPQKQSAGEVKLRIMDTGRAPEFWPVGWPPEKPPREVLPELFKFLPVEIENEPLAKVLEIIGARIKAPILYDYNSLARRGIDPAKVNVSHPAKRTYYKRIIDRLVNQAKLKSDLRVDEAGKPFLWISSLLP